MLYRGKSYLFPTTLKRGEPETGRGRSQDETSVQPDFKARHTGSMLYWASHTSPGKFCAEF